MENTLRAELADGDRIIAGAPSLLRDMIAHRDDALFNARVLAGVRGMATGLARQLLLAQAEAGKVRDIGGFIADGTDRLYDALLGEEPLLAHLHALAIEAQMAAQLHERHAIDPAMPPLMHDGRTKAAPVSELLAAKARFIQQMRQMEHPLSELPDKVFHGTLKLFRAHADKEDRRARDAVRQLRSDYDEDRGRLGLISAFLAALAPGDGRMLRVDQAGLSIFLSALAQASGQERDPIVLSLGKRQVMRLALAMRAAGLDDDAMRAQLLFLHPTAAAPYGFDTVSPELASAMLKQSLAEARAAL